MACFQIAHGARVCDPQQLCQPERLRYELEDRESRSLLWLTEPRSITVAMRQTHSGTAFSNGNED